MSGAPGVGASVRKALSIFAKFGLAIAFAALLPGCEPDKPNGGGGGGGGCPSGQCTGQQQHQLTGAGSQDDPCVYDPIIVRCSNCQLLRLDLAATNATQTPPAVIFEKDGVTSEPTANPATGTWSATTNALNCSTGPGCADGTYIVRLRQPENSVLCSEFGTLTLTLKLS